MFKFSINGSQFWISESVDGYRWMPPNGYGRLWPTILEAQQDAINVVQRHIDVENEIMNWDTYWDNRRHEDE